MILGVLLMMELKEEKKDRNQHIFYLFH